MTSYCQYPEDYKRKYKWQKHRYKQDLRKLSKRKIKDLNQRREFSCHFSAFVLRMHFCCACVPFTHAQQLWLHHWSIWRSSMCEHRPQFFLIEVKSHWLSCCVQSSQVLCWWMTHKRKNFWIPEGEEEWQRNKKRSLLTREVFWCCRLMVK